MHMPDDRFPSSKAKARVNLSIEEALIAQAKALGLNMSSIAEGAIREKVNVERMRKWREDNAQALQSWDALIQHEGLWSDGLRQF